MESTMKKLLVRLVLVGECPLTFFVNAFERGLLSLRETRSAEAALQRNSRGSVILPLTLALLSCHCDHHPVLPAGSSHLCRCNGSASFCIHLHPAVAR